MLRKMWLTVLIAAIGLFSVQSIEIITMQEPIETVEEELPLSPVIFVPGDGGSQMDAKLNKTSSVHIFCQKQTKDFFNIWLNLELLVPLVIDCWIDNVKLAYDNVTRTTSNQAGVETRIPGWGKSEVVEWLDPSLASTGSYFKDIGNALVARGYVRGKSMRGAPYDFRKAPNENGQWFTDMKTLIEETYLQNNNTPVSIIAHSMGAPMSLLFLQRQDAKWKDKFVARIISLAGAWGGSAKAVKVFAIGDDLGSYALSGSTLRAEQITSPSLAWLMPSKYFWKPDEILVRTNSSTYAFKDLKRFFEDLDYMTGWEMYQDTLPYQEDFSAPGVEVHCIYGVGTATVETLYYKKSGDFSTTPDLISGDGDGTVNLRSLEGCMHWTTNQVPKIYTKALSGADHMTILSDNNAINYILNVLTPA